MAKYYKLAKIRKLLMQEFTVEELEQFCRDVPDFKPVYSKLPQRATIAEIVGQLVVYSDQRLLFESLLDWTREHNPVGYEKYQPYYEELPENSLTSAPVGSKKPWWKFW